MSISIHFSLLSFPPTPAKPLGSPAKTQATVENRNFYQDQSPSTWNKCGFHLETNWLKEDWTNCHIHPYSIFLFEKFQSPKVFRWPSLDSVQDKNRKWQLSRVQIHSHPFTLVGYRLPYERMYLVPDCPSSPHVLLVACEQPCESSTVRVEHPNVQARDAQHKMSSQVSARKLLLLGGSIKAVHLQNRSKIHRSQGWSAHGNYCEWFSGWRIWS